MRLVENGLDVLGGTLQKAQHPGIAVIVEEILRVAGDLAAKAADGEIEWQASIEVSFKVD